MTGDQKGAEKGDGTYSNQCSDLGLNYSLQPLTEQRSRQAALPHAQSTASALRFGHRIFLGVLPDLSPQTTNLTGSEDCYNPTQAEKQIQSPTQLLNIVSNLTRAGSLTRYPQQLQSPFYTHTCAEARPAVLPDCKE